MKSSAHILCIDIGGSNIKAIVFNNAGEPVNEYQKVPTPEDATPRAVLNAVVTLIKNFPSYDKVSVGFPGYVRNGIVYTAPNLGNENWYKIPFCNMLSDALKKPVRLLNDADIQSLAVAQGRGLELVVTLGTGFGTAVLYDGKLLPHLELAHHPVTKNKTYDTYIGEKALEEAGEEKWNRRVKKTIQHLKTLFNYDHLYIGGGNAKKINFPLDDNITIINNREGIKGGVKLWQND